jgi:hypothetical protein
MKTSKRMVANKWMTLVMLMVSCLLVVQVTITQPGADAADVESLPTFDANQFPTSLTAVQTEGGYDFKLTVTNNSGTDITVDQMPIFSQMFLLDYKSTDNYDNSSLYRLLEKNWDYDPKVFANGQVIEESFEISNEQLRADGRLDGRYYYYSIPIVVVNNVSYGLPAVYYEFTIETGEDPTQPDKVSDPVVREEMEKQMISWDINQFETSVQMSKNDNGYRFEMNVTNNSGSDLVVDKTPIFSSIMLWDEQNQTWFTLRDGTRGQDIQPQVFGNGQTITETFELPINVDGKYTFNAVPSLVIGDEVGQLTSATISFTVGTGQGSPIDPGDTGNDNPVVDEPGSDGRPPSDKGTETQMPAPDEVAGLNFIDFPTAISTETTANGKRFVMTVTNNSGRDLMLDNLPIFARLIAYDAENGRWLYLREKSWELKPEMFASGTTITETYDMTELKSNYYFYAVPSIVINNNYTQLMNVAAEVELKK